jgi:hypothetical protein
MVSQPGPQLDEGVENLERFNGMVAQAVAALEEDAQRLEAHGEAIERLTASGTEALEALQSSTLERSREMASSRSQAEAALQALGGGLDELAEPGLAGAGQQIAEAGDQARDNVAAARETLEQASDELDSNGLEPATSATDDLDSELDHVREEVASAFATLAAELADAQEEVASAETGADSGITEVVEVAAAQQAELAPVEELAAYVSATYVPDLQAAVDTLETDVRQAYAALAADAEAAHERLVEDATAAVDATVERIEADGEEQLGNAVEEVLEGALPEMAGELQEAEKALAAGAEVTDAAAALVDPLSWSKSVVAEVDRLLDAMKGA